MDFSWSVHDWTSQLILVLVFIVGLISGVVVDRLPLLRTQRLLLREQEDIVSRQKELYESLLPLFREQRDFVSGILFHVQNKV